MRFPSIIPHPDQNAEEDAAALHEACKGAGTDEQAIIDILARRNYRQRKQISVSYKEQFGAELVDDLRSELKHHFERLCVAMASLIGDFLAKEINRAITGFGTNEAALAEILGTADNKTIKKINKAYEKLYEKPLEEDLKSETSGCLERLLVILSLGNRDEGGEVDEIQAKIDAADLWRAGEGRWGTDEETFTMVLTHRSKKHLRVVFDEYEALAGHTFVQAVENEFNGGTEEALVNLVRAMDNDDKYLAERLHEATSGLGTKEKIIIRILTWRSDIDMYDIKKQFESMYGKTLEEELDRETSGHFHDMLLAIID